MAGVHGQAFFSCSLRCICPTHWAGATRGMGTITKVAMAQPQLARAISSTWGWPPWPLASSSLRKPAR
jgi:ABC-type enterobactin transport system permease subunit